MRNRFLEHSGYIDPTYAETTSESYSNPTAAEAFNFVSVETVDMGTTVSYPQSSSNINDEVGDPDQVIVDPATGKWKRVRKKMRNVPFIGTGPLSKSSLRAEDLKPVHKCEHQKTVITLAKDVVIAHERTLDPGNPIFERLRSKTSMYANGGQAVRGIFGSTVFSSAFTGAQDNWTAGPYLNHDWFAITDSFNEACDQFVNSSFLIGEDMIDNAIFVNAFKTVLNPTRALRSLITSILGHGAKKYRKTNLKQMSSLLARESANANLFYNFALKPAIHDLQDAIFAHRKVSERLRLLREGSGRYVPVRVKDELHSSISNSLLETVENRDLKWHCDYKKSTAIMGTWARVREDLSYSDTWSAYLQYFGINKVAGLAWELIPCSFMIDWFSNAQEYINKHTRFSTGSPYNEFRGMWHSIKQETSESLMLIPGWNPALAMPITSPSGSLSLASRQTTNYLRYPGLPNTIETSLDFSTLGLFHSIITGSIIIQRWLK